jgi:hypothetical protein
MHRINGTWITGTPKTDAGLRTVTLPRFLHPLLQGHLDRHVKKRGDGALMFATAAVQTGATLKDTMARLGHASPRAALIYQHTAQDRDHAIAEALDAVAAKARRPRPPRRHRTTGADPSPE